MTAPELPAYVTHNYLDALTLRAGLGSGAPGDRCAIQEVRAWLGLSPGTAAIPECVCPVIGQLVIRLQDYRVAYRVAIVQLLPRLLGSRGDDALTQRRRHMVADWTIRTATPASFRARAACATSFIAARMRAWSDRYAALTPIVDAKSLDAARVLCIEIRAEAAEIDAAAYDTADDAVYAASARIDVTAVAVADSDPIPLLISLLDAA